MNEAELDGLAEWAYRAARLPDDSPASGLVLARNLLRDDVPVIRARSSVAARLTKTPGGWRIYIRPGHSVVQSRWLVAHELAEWLLEINGYRDADTETTADALAARLIAPRRAMRHALQCGLQVGQLATAFAATQSCALLRQAEVSGRPTALITPARVYVRGSEWVWPSDNGVRLLVTEEPRFGLAQVRITDARRRVGLVVD